MYKLFFVFGLKRLCSKRPLRRPYLNEISPATLTRLPFLHMPPYFMEKHIYRHIKIKDCLAYLRLVANPCDSIAMRRAINTPPRGIGAKTELALETLAASAQERRGLEGINKAECLMSLLEDQELDELARALEYEGVDEAREAAEGEQGTGRARWGGFSVRRARLLRKAVESGDMEGVSKAQAKRLVKFAGLLCKIRGVAASQGMPELFKAVVEETDMEK